MPNLDSPDFLQIPYTGDFKSVYITRSAQKTTFYYRVNKIMPCLSCFYCRFNSHFRELRSGIIAHSAVVSRYTEDLIFILIIRAKRTVHRH